MKLFQFLFILAIVFIDNLQSLDVQEDSNIQDHEGKLTGEFAVELDQENEVLAREVARLHGYEFHGTIGSLPRHYLFKKKSSLAHGDDKRDDIPLPSLSEHPNVVWQEEQRELDVQKRLNTGLNREEILNFKMSDRKGRYSSFSKKHFFNDPLLPVQWYINNIPGQVPGVPPHRDMGIQKAWVMGYTGKGIVVTVMDDGLDHTNRDLKDNFDINASKDLNDGDDDPQPRNAIDQYHGTKCSGEIAAAANDHFCGVGIAPHVRIGGVRMLDGSVTGITEGEAFGLKPDYIDIYSASWGPKDNGKTMAGPSSLGQKALKHGVEKGRKGKGSIYVWASGNGGYFKDDCGCDGYASSIYTIAVGSVGPHGKTTYYDERCSGTMAVVYSGDDSQGGNKPLVTTSSGVNGCLYHFGGTSAAAPIAVGVFALVLQANRELTWRDLQHLITKTSKTDVLDHGDDAQWVKNAAGFKVSPHFGFGLLYAPSLIEAAKKWKTVPPQRECVIKSKIEKKEPLKRDGEIILTMISDGCKGTKNEITKLEHVQIVINLQHRHRGALSISIEGPSKTTSKLLNIRPHDESKKGVKNWPFMSVQFWGENPAGKWTLTIKDNSKITMRKRREFRSFDVSEEIQERSEQDDDALKFPDADDEALKSPLRHEIELEDESIAEDESENEGNRDFAREMDEKYNVFDVRSNVYGELESWHIVHYGTNQ